ncbi:MAG: ABC transporter permease [Bacilli bacterium]|nr:ABC transporter permease [Bacilli bacterium]
MRAFTKSAIRTIFANKGRFFANIAIVLLSLSITAGLGSLPESLKDSYLKNYSETTPDITVKTKTKDGLTDEQIATLSSYSGVASYSTFTEMDLPISGAYHRFYIIDTKEGSLGAPKLTEGKLPSSRGDCAVEMRHLNIAHHEIGESVYVGQARFGFLSFDIELDITGIVDSDMYNSSAKERAMLEDEDEEEYIHDIFYIDKNAVPRGFGNIPTTDCYLRFDDRHDYFSDGYYDRMERIKHDLTDLLGEDQVTVLTMEENTSYALHKNYHEKIVGISYVFPFFFMVLCALVNSLTITRLISDERACLGCYHSLGVSPAKMILKYVSFSAISTAIGAIAGYFVGVPVIPKLVLPAYEAVFQMNGASPSFFLPMGIGIAIGMLVLSCAVSTISAMQYLRERPADLFQEKSPKPGKKIFLEYWKGLWKRLPFSWKSSARNIFRKKKNLILTSASVMLSTLLLMAGFALLDASNSLQNDDLFAEVASSMGMISFVVIVFAIAMAVSVVYLLSNMNITDRKRELATLKVLGYTDVECSLYCIRELAAIALVSCLIAIPLSVLIIDLVLFKFLDFGKVEDLRWTTYVIPQLLIVASTAITALLLHPRIARIDMNGSLKSIE